MLDNFWLLMNVLVASATLVICVRFFIRNHTFKKWLRLYEGLVVGYYGVIYALTLVGVISIEEYGHFLRPMAYLILLTPTLECISDWWRKYHGR